MARRRASNELPAGSVDLSGGGDIASEVNAGVENPAATPPGPQLVGDPPAAKRGRRGKAAAAGDVDVELAPGDFLKDTAERDRKSAKAKHIDDGLDSVSEMVDRMRKGLAYARVLHDFEAKLAVLHEVSETAAAVAEDAARAVEAARKETRNLQPKGGAS